MKKMLRIVGIIALAAIIGFGFASCDTGTALQGDRGAAGNPGTPGGVFSAASDFIVRSVGTSSNVAGVSEYTYSSNLAIGETFYLIVELENDGTVDKVISVESSDFSITRAHDNVAGIALSAGPLSATLEPDDVVRVRLTPLGATFGDNETNTGSVTVTGTYGNNRIFERNIEITLTVGVGLDALEDWRDRATDLINTTTPNPANLDDRTFGRYYATPGAVDGLIAARDLATSRLTAVNAAYGNATTRVTANAGQARVNPYVDAIRNAVEGFNRGHRDRPAITATGWTVVVAGDASADIRLGETLEVVLPPTGAPSLAGLSFQWQRQEGGTWRYIPEATGQQLSLAAYGVVNVGQSVRAVVSHAEFSGTANTATVIVQGRAVSPITGAITIHGGGWTRGWNTEGGSGTETRSVVVRLPGRVGAVGTFTATGAANGEAVTVSVEGGAAAGTATEFVILNVTAPSTRANTVVVTLTLEGAAAATNATLNSVEILVPAAEAPSPTL